MIDAIRRRIVPALGFIVAAVPGLAGNDEAASRLIDLLRFEETVAIMRLEGERYGAELGQEMIPDADQGAWRAEVSRIYDVHNMLSLVSADFRKELADADLGPMIAYFETPDGQEIIGHELEARHIFLDPDEEQAAIARFREAEGRDPALAARITRVIDDSDLVDFNVMGALNASLMFYRGLRDGGAYEATEDEIFADVWSQEDETRKSSEEWLEAFLLYAYEPLRPAQLEEYAAFYRTPAGRELNRAIFASFDRMYEEISYLIGRAIAEQMNSVPL